MVIIIGFIIIMGGTLGGFILAEGQVTDLIHKAEIVTILGNLIFKFKELVLNYTPGNQHALSRTSNRTFFLKSEESFW